MSLRERVRDNLREWYALAADRTGEMAKISIRRYDKFGLSREIERQFAELGSLVYHDLVEGRVGSLDSPAIRTLVARIEDLARALENKDLEIEEIRRQRQSKPADGRQPDGSGAWEPPPQPALAPGVGDAAILGSGHLPPGHGGRRWEND